MCVYIGKSGIVAGIGRSFFSFAAKHKSMSILVYGSGLRYSGDNSQINVTLGTEEGSLNVLNAYSNSVNCTIANESKGW